ncbi:hypothetical protein L596_025600 [Steinernema carpocapsae]|uniref:Uncharacterized protein n=1 Tax=Steinernema carpocapsae TaxID=34508 RepID=A0A4U5M882_STECR|nr:hypothetical protein L596_025600 [Steinernema carpocapsae]
MPPTIRHSVRLVLQSFPLQSSHRSAFLQSSAPFFDSTAATSYSVSHTINLPPDGKFFAKVIFAISREKRLDLTTCSPSSLNVPPTDPTATGAK